MAEYVNSCKLAANIKRNLREEDMTQAVLAEILEISQPTLSNWLAGRSGIDVVYIEKMCELFGRTYEELVGEPRRMVVELDPPRNTVKVIEESISVSHTRDFEMQEAKAEKAKEQSMEELQKKAETKREIILAMQVLMENINELHCSTEEKRQMYIIFSDTVRDYKLKNIR